MFAFRERVSDLLLTTCDESVVLNKAIEEGSLVYSNVRMEGFLTVHCSSCFSRASESPSAGHSSFRKTSTSAIHFFKVFTSFYSRKKQ